MDTFGQTSMPVGYYEFCKNYPERCGAKSDAITVELTRQSWRKMVDTNTLVNTEIAPMTDEEIYGVPEKWALPEVVGDCEDYALLKRKMLNEQGFPLGSLLMTVGRDAKGGGHAVLTVVTDKGDYILDNQEDKILLWRDAEIYFSETTGAGRPKQMGQFGAWVSAQARLASRSESSIVSSVPISGARAYAVKAAENHLGKIMSHKSAIEGENRSKSEIAQCWWLAEKNDNLPNAVTSDPRSKGNSETAGRTNSTH
jgi:predicted transglutaminase-like cysteine proteinase